MRRLTRVAATATALLLSTALTTVSAAAPAAAAGTPYTATPVSGPLGTYHVSGVYVAGVSSGGYLATQLQVAYSSRIAGSAVFAAGPYYCAQNNVLQALNGCGDNIWPTYLSSLESYTRLWAAYGWIDPVRNLAGKPMYVFHGGNDGSVKKSVNDDLVTYLRDFGASVQYVTGSAAGHAWVTPYGPVGCSATAAPYLNDCGIDPQRDLLTKLFGGVSAPNTGPLGGTLVKFSQNTYAVGGYAPGLSLDPSGFAYVPAACAAGQSCRLLVALHGCAQGYAAVGTAFVDRANLNQYADTNRMIVLYPQAAAAGVNPNGCWDWWGYLGATNYPIKGGAQIETIMNMVRRLGG
ncbi:PHB depolymerase family esterase [Plantactinospora sp. KBS50]|uniref:extracellular catalytic domain type 2 short-chain-length polyhydroxyalkanoate depolymerase n=1 Tax=Plantactinospora sp. KBS50 TaxID=2024580 RepID=UPI000BAAF7F1|nr:PHB depolymerase family esterase [Plantactinospora sp. KBS50]ASW53150.1 poly(3-hydroxybutyrate) depolymerase [Plantactinospora sp. KBS50]